MSPDQPVRKQDTPLIRIDGQEVRAPGTHVTGIELLSAAGLDPDKRELYAKGHHGLRIGPEDSVEIQQGSEFVTQPRI